MGFLKPATPTYQRGCSLGAKDGGQAAVMVVADKSLEAGRCSLLPDSQLSSFLPCHHDGCRRGKCI